MRAKEIQFKCKNFYCFNPVLDEEQSDFFCSECLKSEEEEYFEPYLCPTCRSICCMGFINCKCE